MKLRGFYICTEAFYSKLEAAPLASRGSLFGGMWICRKKSYTQKFIKKNSLKPSWDPQAANLSPTHWPSKYVNVTLVDHKI